MITSIEIRQKYLNFFAKKGHKIIPSASLVPNESVDLAGTQRVMFTTAGMHPLVPYLLGEPHPEGKRLVNVQKCLRTDDIDEVGDNSHNTFFEMLGNWSLGDPASPDGIGKGGYWKKEAISWSFEFLTEVLKLDKNRLYVSVFAGDDDAPFDQESFEIWQKLGINKSHIFKYGKKDNWWGPVGAAGPCGPDTEMFYDTDPKRKGPIDPSTNSRFVEIWNDVFMQYDKQKNGSFKPLKQKNVDTGMGLERVLVAVNNLPSIYESDLFLPIIAKIRSLAKNHQEKSGRIIADHLRASVFLISDGVAPSNVERGYILRRLTRRAIRHSSLIGIDTNYLLELAKIIIRTYEDFYPVLSEVEPAVFDELSNEEVKFGKALAEGTKQFEKNTDKMISGKAAFDLYQNFGFPLELIKELAKEKNKKVDAVGFEKEYKRHQELSRQMGEKTKGGLAVQSETAAKYHTATHLLHQALRDVLGKHVFQTGSHITNERLRFDFSYGEKLTDQEIENVEGLVNQKIKQNLKVEKELMSQKEADELGAIGLFKQKYGNKVSIYKIGDFSIEYCGGPHASKTNNLGRFKINKEESLGSGKRRIYATLS